MNVYDFDKTIYSGDSTIDFYFFCLKKRPYIIRHIFKQGMSVILNKLGIHSTKTMKENFLCFLKDFSDIDSIVVEFWQKNENKIKAFYLNQKENSDYIISASPEFLLAPICEKLGVHLIATNADKKTGKINGENCKGKEKVLRLNEAEKNFKINKFYSDSRSDCPLAELAEKAYIVRGNEINNW